MLPYHTKGSDGRIIGTCMACGYPIYDGHDRYESQGEMIHWDCTTDYFEKFWIRTEDYVEE